MIAVAIVAGGTCQVTILQQLHSVDAVLIFFNLVDRNPILLHMFGIRVALAAGFVYVCGIDARAGIGRRVNLVVAVATGACRHFGISLHKAFTVYARPIQIGLVHAESGIVFFHELRVAVTSRAHCNSIFSNRLCNKSFGRVHGLLGLRRRRVTPVTTGAGYGAGVVRIAFHIFHWFRQFIAHFRVTFDAVIHLFGPARNW